MPPLHFHPLVRSHPSYLVKLSLSSFYTFGRMQSRDFMSRECDSYLDTMAGYPTRYQQVHFLHKFSLRFLPICNETETIKTLIEKNLVFVHHRSRIEIYIHVTVRAVECRLRSKWYKAVGLNDSSVKRRCEGFAQYRYNPIHSFKSSEKLYNNFTDF